MKEVDHGPQGSPWIAVRLQGRGLRLVGRLLVGHAPRRERKAAKPSHGIKFSKFSSIS